MPGIVTIHTLVSEDDSGQSCVENSWVVKVRGADAESVGRLARCLGCFMVCRWAL